MVGTPKSHSKSPSQRVSFEKDKPKKEPPPLTSLGLMEFQNMGSSLKHSLRASSGPLSTGTTSSGGFSFSNPKFERARTMSITGYEDRPRMPTATQVADAAQADAERKQKLRRLFRSGISKVVLKRMEELDKATLLASYYVVDAFEGRLKNGLASCSKRSPDVLRAFQFQTSDWWLNIVVGCNVLHSVLVLLESSEPESRNRWRWLEICSCIVYGVDVALKIHYMGTKMYLSKPWQQLFLVFTGLLSFDAISPWPWRFRWLRPSILCLRSRSVRRFFTVVQIMVPGFIHVCLPLAFFLLLSSCFASIAFGDQIQELASPGTAGYNIWILTASADNYSKLISQIPTTSGTGAFYLIFFFTVLVVGNIFLLSLMLGVTFDVFMTHTKSQAQSERLKELQGLTMAFSTMDPENTGKLGKVEWDKFLSHLLPHLTKQERILYYEIASGFKDELDIIAFMDLRRVLNYRFVPMAPGLTIISPKSGGAPSGILAPIMQSVKKGAQWLLARPILKKVFVAVVIADTLLLPYGLPNYSSSSAEDRSAESSQKFLSSPFAYWESVYAVCASTWVLSWKYVAGSSLSFLCTAEHLLADVITCVLVLELVLSILSSSVWYSRCTPHEQVAAWAVGLGGALMFLQRFGPIVGDTITSVMTSHAHADIQIIQYSGAVYGWLQKWLSRPALYMKTQLPSLASIAYGIRLLRCWRLITLRERLHAQMETFVRMLPVFLQTLSFAVVIAYSFALVACDTFGGSVEFFNTPQSALLKMVQLFFGVDFGGVIGETVSALGSWTLLFFAAYYVVGIVIVFNLITAILMQLYGEYSNTLSASMREQVRSKDQELQNELVQHLQKQRVLQLWGRSHTQGVAALMVQRKSSQLFGNDLRKVLAGADGFQVTDSELSKCQKFTKCDLKAIYMKRSQGEANISVLERTLYPELLKEDNLEERLTTVQDAVITRLSEVSPCAYFVKSGVVRLTNYKGAILRKFEGELFGELALMGDLPSPAEAVAVGSCVIMRVTREDLAKVNTVTLMGCLAMHLHDSGSFIPHTHDEPYIRPPYGKLSSTASFTTTNGSTASDFDYLDELRPLSPPRRGISRAKSSYY